MSELDHELTVIIADAGPIHAAVEEVVNKVKESLYNQWVTSRPKYHVTIVDPKDPETHLKSANANGRNEAIDECEKVLIELLKVSSLDIH